MRRSLARCSLALVLIAPTSLRAAQPDVAASPATEEGASDMSEGPAEATPAEPVEAPPRLSPRGRTRVITGAVLTGVGGALLVPMAFFTAEHLRHLSRVEQYLDVACGETEGCPPNGSISDEDRAEAATYRDQAAAARAAGALVKGRSRSCSRGLFALLFTPPPGLTPILGRFYSRKIIPQPECDIKRGAERAG